MRIIFLKRRKEGTIMIKKSIEIDKRGFIF